MRYRNSFISIEDKHFYLYKGCISLLLLLFLMIMPDDFFGMFELYHNATPSFIDYKWLDYRFGIVQLIILIIGIILFLYHKVYSVGLVSIYFLIRELLFKNNVFTMHSYEMYLTLFVGLSFLILTIYSAQNYEQLKSFFYAFLFLNVVSVYINRILSSSVAEGSRYHASNLDVGGTGIICAITLFYLLEIKEKKAFDYFFLIITTIALVMSGSRNSVGIFTILLVIKWIIGIFRREDITKEEIRHSILRIIAIAIFIVAVILIFGHQIQEVLLTNRIFTTFLSGNIANDDSFDGRSRSIAIGLDIIKDHPFGISGWFTNLQEETRMRGFPTFPHSDIICFYLMYGPVTIILYIYVIIQMIKNKGIHNTFLWPLLFLLLYSIISGGAETNFKIIYIYGVVIYLFIRTRLEYERN